MDLAKDKRWDKAMAILAFELQEALKEGLAKEGAEDTGRLGQSIFAKANPDGIEIIMPGYAKYVEFGTPGRLAAPKGMAPNPGRKMPVKKVGNEFVSYLHDWGRRHGAKTPQEQFALAKHVQLYGTRPHPFARNTFEEKFTDLLVNALNEAFN